MSQTLTQEQRPVERFYCKSRDTHLIYGGGVYLADGVYPDEASFPCRDHEEGDLVELRRERWDDSPGLYRVVEADTGSASFGTLGMMGCRRVVAVLVKPARAGE